MTVINPNSISGITSITLPSGDGNVLTIHTNDGTERFRIDSSGNVKVGSACTISQDGDVFFTGVTTATTFTGAHSGSGANLTALPAAQVTGTLPAISGANLTSLTAGNLTGALPAISGANLTGIAATDNVRTGILDVAGIATFRSDVNIPNINGGQVGGRRNIIINGAMQVSQRGTSFTPGNTATSTYTLDRMQSSNSHDGALTITQSSTAPDGFANSLKVDVTTADTSLASGQYAQILYKPEAQDLQQLAFGTSGAKDSILSFYVRSNKTGNYGVAVLQHDNGSKQVSFQYTINSANTWERKTFLIPGDTSGVINNDNGRGFDIHIGFASGTQFTSGSLRSSFTTFADGDLYAGQGVNLLDSTSNEWYITGVQLEVGSTATAFEHRSFGEELLLCQRYFHKSLTSYWFNLIEKGSTYRRLRYEFPTTMRTTPTVSNATGSNNGSGGTPTGTQNGSAKKITFHWDSAGLVDLYTNTEFSAEL